MQIKPKDFLRNADTAITSSSAVYKDDGDGLLQVSPSTLTGGTVTSTNH